MDKNFRPSFPLPACYQVGRSLGKGQFGEVFYAEDNKYRPARKVAIKIFNSAFLNEPGLCRDIEKEASTLARFKHPHILRIIDFDINERIAYIVTDWAEGGSLDKIIRPDPNKPPQGLRLNQVEVYLEQLAEAVDEAHSKDIIHRDIKLQNILLDQAGQILLADFGLARALSASQSTLTLNNGIAGTPQYMAPEQWLGKPDKLSDIYALGVVAYHLLIGKPPFQGNQLELMGQHLTQRVPLLSQTQPDLAYPKALDEVIAYAMNKDLKQRARSAREFVHYFKAVLKGEKVDIKSTNSTVPVPDFPFLKAKSQDNYYKQPTVAIPAVKKASALNPWPEKVQFLTLPHQLRNYTTIAGHNKAINALAFSPSRQLLASASADNTIRLWNIETQQVITSLIGHQKDVQAIAFSPDGQLLVSGSADSTVRLWDVDSGKLIHTFNGHTDYVWSVAFSPQGNLIASGGDDQVILLWDVKKLKNYGKLFGHSRYVNSVTFSPDGNLLASGAWDKTIRLWDVHSCQQIRQFNDSYSMINSVAFNPNGKLLASGTNDHKIKVWDVSNGNLLLVISEHLNTIKNALFSRDGHVIISASEDKTIRLWKLSAQPNSYYINSREISAFIGHPDAINSVAISPNGSMIASGGEDGKIRLWVLTE